MDNSRTKNALRNIVSGFTNKIIVLILPFIIRTIMIKTLGLEYLGLNSLFTSILQVLNLAELGFSSAIVFSMYKPITENDDKTICALMNLYKKIYRIIGSIIFMIGIIILPFLKFLIKGSFPEDINIYLLFIFYLVNTSITYFLFAYKRSLLIAHQRSDIDSNILTITSIMQYVLQAIILIVFKNYYMYIIVNIITNIVNNIIVGVITDKKYPMYKCKGSIGKDIKTGIRKRVSGLIIQRVCSTTRNSLDSIFISAFLGLNVVAIYTNYYTILSALVGIMSIVSTAILAGVGNSVTLESKEKNYKDMTKFNFIYMWISGVFAICLLCLYQPFMRIWMGKEYLASNNIVVLLCLYFYALKMGDIRATYSDAKGLWWENRYRAIVESIANVILNFILGKLFGLAGIILATLISLLIINFGYGTQILFKYYFTNVSVCDYFKRQFKYFVITIIAAFTTVLFCKMVMLNGIIEIVVKMLICSVVPNIIYVCFYIKSDVFKDSLLFLKNIFKKLSR